MNNNNIELLSSSQNNQSNNVSMDYGENFGFQPPQKIKTRSGISPRPLKSGRNAN